LSVVLDRRLLFVSGKGGVGKSAVATSLALNAARHGKRVLLLGMIDGLGLAVHLGVNGLDADSREVAPGVFAAAIDRLQALDEYIKLQLRLPKVAPTRQFSRALNVLVETAPGIREIVSMGKPIFEAQQRHWDLVIVDAPPVGSLISYLRAPATVARIVPTGSIQDQAKTMKRYLASSDRTGLILVTIPEELPIIETIEALDELAEEPLIDLAAIVVNRVLAPLGVSEDVLAELPATPIRAAATLHHTLQDHQMHWLDAIPDARRLPHLFGLLTPGEVAARLSEEWDSP
jgi:anion-transporting  ArsA/GET3 family ATPase